MSKKLLIILSALLIAASLSACKDNGENNTEETLNQNIESSETTTGNDEETDEGETGSQVKPPIGETIGDPGEYEYTEKNDKIYVLGSNLNLRTADYEKAASVVEGTELQRIGISEGGYWSKVLYEGQELYVSNKYTTMLADLDEGFTAVEKTLVAAKSLKCHIAPEEDYAWQEDVKIVKWYAEGDEIKVVMENNAEDGWYKVEFTNADGEKAYGYMYANPENYVADETDTGDEESTTAAEESTTATEEVTTEAEEETSAAEASDKSFTVENMTITLTSDFSVQAMPGFTAAYVDEKNVVMAFTLQEKFSLMEGFEDWTLNQYAEALKGNVAASDVSEIKTENGITYFEYEFTNTSINAKYYYYTTVFKSADSFWSVQFACLAEDKADFKPIIEKYAKSVTFAE